MKQPPEIVYVPFQSAYGYQESGQSVQARMAFLNKVGNVYTEMFLPVMCRDYLNDILHLEYWKLPKATICGFSYDGRVPKIDRDKVRLSLQCASQAHFDNMKAQLARILHPVETQNKFELTTIYQPTEKVLILEGDSRWLSSTITLSTYTLLVRISGLAFVNIDNWFEEIASGKHKTGDRVFFQDRLTQPMRNILQRLSRVAETFKGQPPAGWDQDSPIDTVHFQSGLISGLLGTTTPLQQMVRPLAA